MDMSEYLDIFKEESREYLQKLNEALLVLEKNPESKEAVEELFRIAHSLKGMSATMGFTGIADFTHHMEDLLEKFHKGERKVTPALVDLMFECFDVLGSMLESAVSGEEKEFDLSKLVARIEAEKEEKSLPEEKPEVKPNKKSESSFKTLESQTVRVNIAHLDHLVNLIGELVISRARLEGEEAFADNPKLRQTLEGLGSITRDLRDEIMKTRMVPIGNVFKRFPRMVRDDAHKLGKEINFVMEGEEIELDRTVLDEIGEPLVHLLRNAVAHGIETPEERKKAGKPKEGKIKLSASREKDFVLIAVEDDGGGINPKKVRKSVVEKGFLKVEEAKAISDEEIIDYITRPGFSTVSKATSLAGRGIGVDVVKEKVEMLAGSVEVISKRGEGTTFILRLPLTLAIIQALLVELDGSVFAIPSNVVTETAAVSDLTIKTVQAKEVIVVHDKVVPLIRLREAFKFVSSKTQGSGSGSYVVIVQIGDEERGLVVDSFLGNQEIVIKPLSEMFRDLRGIGGATVLGDGRVALILDVRGLVQETLKTRLLE